MDAHIPMLRSWPLLLLFLSSLAGADVLDDIIERGTIRFGVAEFVPWTMKSESGELIGFEVDVAKKIVGQKLPFERTQRFDC